MNAHMDSRACGAACAVAAMVAVAFVVGGAGPALPLAPSAPVAQNNASPQPAGQELAWPRSIKGDNVTLTVYQPQIDTWTGRSFKARCAVQAVSADGKTEDFGVVNFSANADVDKAARIVTLSGLTIDSISFPTDKTHEASYRQILQSKLPAGGAMTMTLEHAEATFALSQDVQKTLVTQVRNDPPRIIVSTSPAFLVLVDGPPVWRQVDGASAQRVLNTQVALLCLQDGSPPFLYGLDRWFTAPGLDGPWTQVTILDPSLVNAKDALVAAKAIDPMDPTSGTTPPANIVPFVSTVPAELILVDGPAQFLPIQGTNLFEVQNTDSPLFRYTNDGMYYALISGRWFKAPSLDAGATWTFVPGASLPPDFAQIPSDHPRANVLVSVPGTPQAKEAAIAASIPQTATIQRGAATLSVNFDGAPQFKPIDSTPMQYAVNTATPVIQTGPSNFYAVQNGVWFAAPAPTGPWAAATNVPPVIYTIPASSPLHYVTYVRIYGSTDQVVYTGYTPGYQGVYVAPDGTVVYGTGYAYPVYVGSVWYPPPPTYGYGAAFGCGALTGFAFGFAAGAIWGGCCHPWYGGWGYGWHGGWDYSHVNINSTNVYNHWGTQVAHVNHAYGYNAWTGNEFSGTRSSTFNPYNGRTTANEHGGVYNPYSGNYASGSKGGFYNPTSGVAGAHERTTTGTVGQGGSTDGRGAVYNTNTGNGVGWNNGNVYADHDGNVYHHQAGTGWQQRSGDSWSQAPAERTQQLNNDAWGRNVGNERMQSYQGAGAYRGGGGGGYRGGGGSGGFRGGGGRR